MFDLSDSLLHDPQTIYYYSKIINEIEGAAPLSPYRYRYLPTLFEGLFLVDLLDFKREISRTQDQRGLGRGGRS